MTKKGMEMSKLIRIGDGDVHCQSDRVMGMGWDDRIGVYGIDDVLCEFRTYPQLH